MLLVVAVVVIAWLFFDIRQNNNNIDTFLHFGFPIDFSFSCASFAPFGPHVYLRCLVLRLPVVVVVDILGVVVAIVVTRN